MPKSALSWSDVRRRSPTFVFGSVARGDATEASDIDFLVDLDEGRNLLDLGGLLMDLRDLLGHDVEVVTESGLRPRSAVGFSLTPSTCDAPVPDDPTESRRAGLTNRRKAPVTERDGTCTAAVIFCVTTRIRLDERSGVVRD